jgi:hypothetical protein
MGKFLVKMQLSGIKMDLITRIRLIAGISQRPLVLIGDLGINRENPLGVNKRGDLGVMGIDQMEIKSLVAGTRHLMGVMVQVGAGEEEVVVVVEISLAEEDPLVMVSLQVGKVEKTIQLAMIKEVAGANPRGLREVERVDGSLFLLGVIVDQVGTKVGKQIKRPVGVWTNGTAGTNRAGTMIKLKVTMGAKVLFLICLQKGKMMVLVGEHPNQVA